MVVGSLMQQCVIVVGAHGDVHAVMVVVDVVAVV